MNVTDHDSRNIPYSYCVMYAGRFLIEYITQAFSNYECITTDTKVTSLTFFVIKSHLGKGKNRFVRSASTPRFDIPCEVRWGQNNGDRS